MHIGISTILSSNDTSIDTRKCIVKCYKPAIEVTNLSISDHKYSQTESGKAFS